MIYGAANSIFLSHTDESSKDETRVCGCTYDILHTFIFFNFETYVSITFI
jgi:hypothetical protein